MRHVLLFTNNRLLLISLWASGMTTRGTSKKFDRASVDRRLFLRSGDDVLELVVLHCRINHVSTRCLTRQWENITTA